MRKFFGRFTSCVALAAVTFTAGCGGSEQSAGSRSGMAPAATAPGFDPASASKVKAKEAPSPPHEESAPLPSKY